MLSLYRYEKSNYDFIETAKLFEKEKIDFIPLKGVVLRELYPMSWMRTSCDIDILIKKELMETATECLLNAGLKKGEESPHDVTFITSSGTHIELHHTLIEDKEINNANRVLDTVWDNTTLHDGYSYWHDMNDETFYFYHIAHMAKHVLYGGCGIKPFVDLWMLDSIKGIDPTKRDGLLEKGGLLKFANASRKLACIWFGDAERDLLSRQLEIFIFRGGVYGNNENRVAIQQQKKGGSLRYALSRIFLPYRELKYHYPILQKHRWLTPIMEVRRWFKLIFCGHVKRTVSELKYSQSISTEKANEAMEFLTKLGL